MRVLNRPRRCSRRTTSCGRPPCSPPPECGTRDAPRHRRASPGAPAAAVRRQAAVRQLGHRRRPLRDDRGARPGSRLASSRPWWARHGALVQEFVPSAGRDLRLLCRRRRGRRRRGSGGSGRRVAHERLGRRSPRDRRPAARGGQPRPSARPGARDRPRRRRSAPLGRRLGGAGAERRRRLRRALRARGRDLYARSPAPSGCRERRSGIRGCPDVGSRSGWNDVDTQEGDDHDQTVQGLPAEVGDLIQITGHVVGDAPRNAEILEVLGRPGHEHFRVRWEDDHESIYFPADDAVITRAEDLTPPRRRRSRLSRASCTADRRGRASARACP